MISRNIWKEVFPKIIVRILYFNFLKSFICMRRKTDVTDKSSLKKWPLLSLSERMSKTSLLFRQAAAPKVRYAADCKLNAFKKVWDSSWTLFLRRDNWIAVWCLVKSTTMKITGSIWGVIKWWKIKSVRRRACLYLVFNVAISRQGMFNQRSIHAIQRYEIMTVIYLPQDNSDKVNNNTPEKIDSKTNVSVR